MFLLDSIVSVSVLIDNVFFKSINIDCTQPFSFTKKDTNKKKKIGEQFRRLAFCPEMLKFKNPLVVDKMAWVFMVLV
jgi:hypothetical protein